MIFSRDFTGDSLGASPPYGSLVSSPLGGGLIVNGGIDDGGHCVQLGGPGLFGVRYSDGIAYSSFSAWFAFNDNGVEIFGNSLAAGIAATTSIIAPESRLFDIKTEADGTISVYLNNGALLGNSGDVSLEFKHWFNLQVNATLADVAGVVNAAVDVALDGTLIISGSASTGVATASLVNGAAITALQHERGTSGQLIDRYRFDTLAAIPSDPSPGSPKVRVSQAAIEVIELPDEAKLRVSQGAIEVIELPDEAKVRVSQGVIELVIQTPNKWLVYEA